MALFSPQAKHLHSAVVFFFICLSFGTQLPYSHATARHVFSTNAKARLLDSVSAFSPAFVALTPYSDHTKLSVTSDDASGFPSVLVSLRPNTHILHEQASFAVYKQGQLVNQTIFDPARLLHGSAPDGTYVHGYVRQDGSFSGVIHLYNGTQFSLEPLHLFEDTNNLYPAHTHVIYGHHDVHQHLLIPDRICGLDDNDPYFRRSAFAKKQRQARSEDTVRTASFADSSAAMPSDTLVLQDAAPSPSSTAAAQAQGQGQGQESSAELAQETDVVICHSHCTCTVTVAADATYFAHYDRNHHDVVLAMVTHVSEADLLFRRTVFDGKQGFGLAVGRVIIYEDDSPPSPVVTDKDYAPGEFLGSLTSSRWNDSCLAHLFTHRDFDGGVLGVAWIGGPGAGICSTSGRNTGFTTSMNNGKTISQAVSLITITHELGHNWGAPHDLSPGCRPGGPRGNYIMAPAATDGSLPNNKYFSPCSRNSIAPVLKGADCFITSETDLSQGHKAWNGSENATDAFDPWAPTFEWKDGDGVSTTPSLISGGANVGYKHPGFVLAAAIVGAVVLLAAIAILVYRKQAQRASEHRHQGGLMSARDRQMLTQAERQNLAHVSASQAISMLTEARLSLTPSPALSPSQRFVVFDDFPEDVFIAE
eukprot:m.94109 g.94109  ORF g.94109 m.94109 type:complete len:647 (+) comp14715_c1_seq4:133-2073(+)